MPFVPAGAVDRPGEGLASNATFRAAAFSPLVKDELQNSDVINISDTHIVFMHLNESKAPELKALADVKDTIVAEIKNKQAKSKAEDMAAQLLAAVSEENKTLSEVAEANELTLVEAAAVKRTGSEYPFTLVKGVFDMALPDSEQTALEILPSNGNDVALVLLKDIVEADLEGVNLKTETAQLSRNVAANEQQLLVKALREKADVYINEDMLSQSNF